MSKETTGHMVERARSICDCGSCLTCKMASRLIGQKLEIKNLLGNIGTYVHISVWRGQMIGSAIKHLKAGRDQTALSTLQDYVTDGDKVLRELAS